MATTASMTAEPGHQGVCRSRVATIARTFLLEEGAKTLLPLSQISKKGGEAQINNKEGEVEVCFVVAKPAHLHHRHSLIINMPVVDRVPVGQNNSLQLLPAELLKDIARRLFEKSPRSAT